MPKRLVLSLILFTLPLSPPFALYVGEIVVNGERIQVPPIPFTRAVRRDSEG